MLQMQYKFITCFKLHDNCEDERQTKSHKTKDIVLFSFQNNGI